MVHYFSKFGVLINFLREWVILTEKVHLDDYFCQKKNKIHAKTNSYTGTLMNFCTFGSSMNILIQNIFCHMNIKKFKVKI